MVEDPFVLQARLQMMEDPCFRVLSGYKWWSTRADSTSPTFGVESQARSRNFTSTTRRVTSTGSTRQAQFKQTDVSKASSPGSQLTLAMRKKLGCNRFKASPGHAKKHKHFTTRCCLQVRQFILTKLVASTQGSQFILAQKKLARKKATTSRPVEVTSYVSHGQRQSTERTFEHSKRKNVLYSFLLLLT